MKPYQSESKKCLPQFWPTYTGVLLSVFFFLLGGLAHAQSFSSGSNGSDGPLDFSASPPNTVIVFDPSTFNPPLDTDGDRVFHFTTINIPAGVTLKFRADVLGTAPINWLATGAVQINGTLDLSGAKGHLGDVNASFIPAVPGPGGFPGGLGARPGIPCLAGFGPGGGHCNGGGGRLSGTNDFLLPLVGGSGGAGYDTFVPAGIGSGGGAGGGAFLIASTVSIAVGGTINASGGEGGDASTLLYTNGSGGGGGGAVRLMAPVATVSGTITVKGGIRGKYPNGAFTNGVEGLNGTIRLESEQLNVSGDVSSGGLNSGKLKLVKLIPSAVILPATGGPSIVQVTTVAGVPVPVSPTGSFTAPDLAITSPTPVTMDIAAKNIPLGTTVKLILVNQTTGQQNVTSTALTGTVGQSTATAQATFAAGVTQVLVEATWTP